MYTQKTHWDGLGSSPFHSLKQMACLAVICSLFADDDPLLCQIWPWLKSLSSIFSYFCLSCFMGLCLEMEQQLLEAWRGLTRNLTAYLTLSKCLVQNLIRNPHLAQMEAKNDILLSWTECLKVCPYFFQLQLQFCECTLCTVCQDQHRQVQDQDFPRSI